MNKDSDSDANLPLRVVVTIPAFGPSDPSDATVASAVMYRAITITRILTADETDRPKVVSIQRLRPGSQTVASAFLEQKIPSEPFNVRIVLSEKPKGIPDVTKTADELAKQLVDIGGDEGVVSNLVIGTPFEILRVRLRWLMVRRGGYFGCGTYDLQTASE